VSASNAATPAAIAAALERPTGQEGRDHPRRERDQHALAVTASWGRLGRPRREGRAGARRVVAQRDEADAGGHDGHGRDRRGVVVEARATVTAMTAAVWS